MTMKSLIDWRFLSGLSIALTIALFYLLFMQVDGSKEQTQAIVANLSKSLNATKDKDDKLKFALDSITKEVTRLTSRVALLEAQKDSLSKGISGRPLIDLKATPSTPILDQNYYMNCENLIQIDIPRQYANSKLKYSSEYANIQETPDLGRIVVLPLARNVKIIVESGGTVIKTVLLNIKNVPDPEYSVYLDGKKIDLKRGISWKTLTSFRVVAEPDANFRKAVPKDARYHIRRFEVTVIRGSSAILRRVCNSEEVDLKAERSLLKPGDVFQIDVTNAVRLTYKDREELIRTTELTFPIY